MTFPFQERVLNTDLFFLDIVITISQTVSTYRLVANEGKSEFR